MFRSARIKLTAWYLLIIMLISVSFSVAIYRVLTSELDRIERIQQLRFERGSIGEERMPLPPEVRIESPGARFLDVELVAEIRNRLKMILAFIDLGIVGVSTVAGYFLAGRTLRPIREMVDEQNRFITDASHELRTPLTALKAEIEVNLRDRQLTLQGAEKLLKSNLEEVNNLQVLSDELIKLTQYQGGTNGLTFAKVSLISVFDEACKKVAGLAKSKHILIVNRIKNFTIEGNKQTLIELFVILLDNAIKYSPNHTRVNLTSQKTDGHIVVQVADQGVGIDKNEMSHVFDRFYRTDKSRVKSDISGYGLGLSIAWQIVDRHQGTIKVESQLGVGTVFTVQLPVKHSRKLI